MITFFVFMPRIFPRLWKELASNIVRRYIQSKENPLLCYGLTNYCQGFARFPVNSWSTVAAPDSAAPSDQAATGSA